MPLLPSPDRDTHVLHSCCWRERDAVDPLWQVLYLKGLTRSGVSVWVCVCVCFIAVMRS